MCSSRSEWQARCACLWRLKFKHLQGQTNGQSGEWGEAEEHGGEVTALRAGGHLGKRRLSSRQGQETWECHVAFNVEFPQFKVLGGPSKAAVLNL